MEKEKYARIGHLIEKFKIKKVYFMFQVSETSSG